MVIKVTTTSIQEIKDSDRFEPRYHYVFNKFDEYERSSKFQILKFGDKKILQKITDGEHAGQTFVEKGVRFVKNSAVKDFTINLYDGFFITEEKHKQQKRSALKPLDILFTTIGHLGATAIVPESFGEANINQNVVKIEIDKNFIDPYYLTAYLNGNTTKKQIAALFTGNIHSIITYPKIKNIRIIIPKGDFQKKIAKKYKQAIEFDQSCHVILEKAKNFFYQKLNIDFLKIQKEKTFSVNLSDFAEDDIWTPAFSYPLYVNTLKAIQKKWKTVSLGEIATPKKGDEVGSDNYNKYLDKKDSDIPFNRTSDLVNYELDQFPDFYIPKEIYQELKQDVKTGDVLFTKDGKVGMSAMITRNDKAIIASGMVRLRLKAEAKKYHLTPEYLFIILSLKETGLYPAIRRTVVASTIPHLREERLKEFEIPILDKNSIDEITKLVKKAFELKDEKKKLIKEVREEIDSYFEI
jgi:type I restriction enzyme, S subunit